jgi:HAD superfamily hydrolase (TIGR01549 family)
MIKAVLFDVDGVLIDSAEGNARYFSHVFKKFGKKPISIEEYKKNFYNLSSRKVFEHFFPDKTEAEREDIARYGSSAIRLFFKYIKLNPGAAETLDSLRKGCRLGIVTSRKTMEILDYLRIKDYFEVIVGYHDSAKHKPHPEPIHMALEKMKIKPGEAVYIGDAASDVEACKAAGVKVIIYRNPEVRGDFNIKDLKEIPKIIVELKEKKQPIPPPS